MPHRQVGDVATNYHAVSLKIKSVLDSTNADGGDAMADEGRDSTVAGMDTTDDESQVLHIPTASHFCNGAEFAI